MAKTNKTIKDLKITLDSDTEKTIEVPTQAVEADDNGELSFTLAKKPGAEFIAGNNKVSVIYKSEGGTTVNVKATLNLSGTDNKTAKLTPRSSVTLNFRGQMAIGPEAKPAVELAVRFGNMNKNKDWIIDFSDKLGDEAIPGTNINVGGLIEWLNKKNAEIAAEENNKLGTGSNVEKLELEKPDLLTEEQFEQVKNYIIEFKEFHFNITQKTFRIEIESKDDEQITIGSFTLKKVGLLVTNEELTEEEVKLLA